MQLPSNIAKTLQQANVVRNLALPGLVATLALAVSVTGAIFVSNNEGVDGVNGLVETLSGRSSTFLGGLGLLAPLGFAFAAGLVSAVNPCGFAMLPAYLGLYLGSSDQTTGSPHPVRHMGRALLVSGAVTAGFVVLFGVASAVIGLGARSLVAGVLPWLGLAAGRSLPILSRPLKLRNLGKRPVGRHPLVAVAGPSPSHIRINQPEDWLTPFAQGQMSTNATV